MKANSAKYFPQGRIYAILEICLQCVDIQHIMYHATLLLSLKKALDTLWLSNHKVLDCSTIGPLVAQSSTL